jgi:hypothetical protein
MSAGKSGSYRLSALLFMAVVLLPGYSSAECAEPTNCYCGLVPHSDDDAIVRAEVTRADAATTSIRVLGAPFYDPDGSITSGQVLEDLEYRHKPYLAAGDVGLFLVRESENQIAFYIPEEGGRYLCKYDPDFPGLDMLEVTQLVLSGDCLNNARALGIEGNCDPIVTGCCNNEVIMFHQPAALLLVLGVVHSYKRRRK